MAEKRYKWATPYEWLREAVQEWQAARLQNEVLQLASRLSSDELQDEYQSEMEADGYFEETP